MDTEFYIGLAMLAAVAAFVVFAFRQGMKVKPDPAQKPDDWKDIWRDIRPGGPH
jgi:hypothetical protein